jgi:hypothetical protein
LKQKILIKRTKNKPKNIIKNGEKIKYNLIREVKELDLD